MDSGRDKRDKTCIYRTIIRVFLGPSLAVPHRDDMHLHYFTAGNSLAALVLLASRAEQVVNPLSTDSVVQNCW